MDIPDDTLEEFKCSRCEGYLCQSPVFLQHDGATVCGRCHVPERPATRNKQYEAAARFLRFPCKNRDLGCRHTLPYAAEQDRDMHEEVCDHRQYVCPVLGSCRCNWLGSRSDILKHCQAQHPDRVLHSPCALTHDISKSNEDTFLLRALQVLFLLHTKVCVATGKLYHAVRLLGASDEAANYSYSLDIRRGRELLSKKGQVAGQGCLAIQEPTSLALDTNSLLSVLGGFDGTTFTVTVKRLLHEVCTGCREVLKTLLYRDDEGWRCENCAPATRACWNQHYGCQHRDMDSKCRKHELYFCEQRTTCLLCDEKVSRGALLAHYDSAHKNITNSADSAWRATRTSQFGRNYLVSGAAGTAVCRYWLNNTNFALHVQTPVSSAQLSEFRCLVRLTDPATGNARNFTPETDYNSFEDWRITIQRAEMSSWSGQFDICVAVTKTKTTVH